MKNMLVGSDGCLIRTQSKLISGWEKCDDLKVLQAYAKPLPEGFQDGLKWSGPKIPTEMMRRMWATMKEFPKREVGFMLYMNVDKGEWYVKCPPQRGSGGSVFMEDKGEGVPEGFAWIGTVHTHPNMGAFWSGTDQNDQKAKYGLHFVFGLDDGVPKRWKVTIFTPRASYDQEILDVVEALPDDKNLGEPVKEWLEVLNKPLPEKERPSYTYSASNYRTSLADGHSIGIKLPAPLDKPARSMFESDYDRRATAADIYLEEVQDTLDRQLEALFDNINLLRMLFPGLDVVGAIVSQLNDNELADDVFQDLLNQCSDGEWDFQRREDIEQGDLLDFDGPHGKPCAVERC